MNKIQLSALISALALPAIADVSIAPVDQSMFSLLSDGWEIIAEAGNGVFVLSNGDDFALCTMDLRGGHMKVIRGEEVGDGFEAFTASCAAISE